MNKTQGVTGCRQLHSKRNSFITLVCWLPGLTTILGEANAVSLTYFKGLLFRPCFYQHLCCKYFLYTTNIRLWAMMFLKKHTDSERSKCEIITQPPQILLPYNMPFQGHCLFWCWTSDNFDHLELQPLFFPPRLFKLCNATVILHKRSYGK